MHRESVRGLFYRAFSRLDHLNWVPSQEKSATCVGWANVWVSWVFTHMWQGNTGVPLGMLLVSLVVLVALVTVMSGIGVCGHCGVGGGGIYSMISTVLGGRVGGTVGLLYVFGQVRVASFFFKMLMFQLLLLMSTVFGQAQPQSFERMNLSSCCSASLGPCTSRASPSRWPRCWACRASGPCGGCPRPCCWPCWGSTWPGSSGSSGSSCCCWLCWPSPRWTLSSGPSRTSIQVKACGYKSAVRRGEGIHPQMGLWLAGGAFIAAAPS